jgi:phospholipase A-2-activating protein
MEVVSCGEDGSVVVWSGTEIVQTIPHPTSVWCVLAIPAGASGAEGDFVTAGHDGVLRFFSRDVERLNRSTTAPQMTHDFLAEVMEAAQKKRKGPSADELAKAPRWDLRGQHNGTSENQVMVFNRDGTMIAAQWISGAWVVIGEVTGSGDGGYIGEVWFDHVLPVEIETPAGLKTLKLGHNNGENPFVAAQRFIEQNSLGQNYLSQIADWVMTRSGQTVPTLGTAGGATNTQQTQQYVSSGPTFSFKLVTYFTFEDIPVATKLFAKVTELNQAETRVAAKLSERELELVYSTLSTLCDTSHYHSSVLGGEQLKSIAKMATQWEAAAVFPAFDILRLVAIHPSGADSLATLLTSTGGSIIRSALELLVKTDGSVPHTAAITVSRFLCNALKNGGLRNLIVSTHFRDLLNVVSVLATHNNKQVRVSAASIAMNCAVIVSATGTIEVRSALVAVSGDLIRGEKENSDAIFRALKTLGTVLVTTPVADKIAVFGGLDVSSLLHQLAREWSAERLGDAAFKCLHEVLLIST